MLFVRRPCSSISDNLGVCVFNALFKLSLKCQFLHKSSPDFSNRVNLSSKYSQTLTWMSFIAFVHFLLAFLRFQSTQNPIYFSMIRFLFQISCPKGFDFYRINKFKCMPPALFSSVVSFCRRLGCWFLGSCGLFLSPKASSAS